MITSAFSVEMIDSRHERSVSQYQRFHQSHLLISNTKLHSKSRALNDKFCGTHASGKQWKWIFFPVHFRCFVGYSEEMLIFLHMFQKDSAGVVSSMCGLFLQLVWLSGVRMLNGGKEQNNVDEMVCVILGVLLLLYFGFLLLF